MSNNEKDNVKFWQFLLSPCFLNPQITFLSEIKIKNNEVSVRKIRVSIIHPWSDKGLDYGYQIHPWSDKGLDYGYLIHPWSDKGLDYGYLIHPWLDKGLDYIYRCKLALSRY